PLRRRPGTRRPLMGRVVVVGSVQQRVVVDVLRIPVAGETATSLRTRRSLGGRGVLQAVAARRAGADVAMVAAIGDDETGRWCRERLVRAGIAPRLQVVAAELTGQAIVAREDGDRDAVIHIPGADAALDSRTALDAPRPTTWSSSSSTCHRPSSRTCSARPTVGSSASSSTPPRTPRSTPR